MTSYIVDAAVYEQEKESRMSARRFNKHIAERKRRARINTALDELKTMILGNMNKDPEEFDKMEKADILDLTVKFLRAAQQPKAPAAPVRPRPVKTASYQAGYSHSLDQVQRYVASSDLDQATAARLAAHLRARAAIPAQPRTAQPVVVKRCDPSPRLCRNISREISHLAPSPAKFGTDSLTSSFRGLQTSAKCHPAVSHRVVPAHRAVGVWRPWEGQVSA